MILRSDYIEAVKPFMDAPLVKILTGVRRCGKSTIFEMIRQELLERGIPEDHIIKFAFDTAQDLVKIGENPIILDNEKEDRKIDPSKFLNWLMPQIEGDGMYYLLLDEVQMLGAFESVLNGFLRNSKLIDTTTE